MNFRAICTLFTTLLYTFYGRKTGKDILQPWRILERYRCDKKNYLKPPRYLKKPQKSGWSSKRCGRYSFLRQREFLGRDSTWQHPTKSIRQTFFFCRTTNYYEGAKFSNTHSPLSMSPAATKRPNPWLLKILMKSLKLFKPFTSAALWRGLKCCKLILGANSWALSQKKWKIEKHISGEGA